MFLDEIYYTLFQVLLLLHDGVFFDVRTSTANGLIANREHQKKLDCTADQFSVIAD